MPPARSSGVSPLPSIHKKRYRRIDGSAARGSDGPALPLAAASSYDRTAGPPRRSPTGLSDCLPVFSADRLFPEPRCRPAAVQGTCGIREATIPRRHCRPENRTGFPVVNRSAGSARVQSVKMAARTPNQALLRRISNAFQPDGFSGWKPVHAATCPPGSRHVQRFGRERGGTTPRRAGRKTVPPTACLPLSRPRRHPGPQTLHPVFEVFPVARFSGPAGQPILLSHDHGDPLETVPTDGGTTGTPVRRRHLRPASGVGSPRACLPLKPAVPRFR